MRAAARVFAAVVLAGAALPVLAGPAEAICVRGWEEELAAGSAVAIATRIDDGDDTMATFRVERSFGVDLPPTLTGRVNGGMDYAPTVNSQQLTALVFRRDGGWVLACDVNLGEVLDRFDGPPRAVSTGQPVAVAAGFFGGSNLVTLDRFGRPVAWGPKTETWPGWTSVCPGAYRVVTLERDKDDRHMVAVYDTADLKLLRTYPAPLPPESRPGGVDCTEARGVEVVVEVDGQGSPSSLSRLTVRRGAVIREEVVSAGDSDAVASYRVLDGDRLIQVPEGDPRLRTARPGDTVEHSVVTGDGEIAAVSTYGTQDQKTYERRGDGQILIIDQKTQRVLARWKPGATVAELAWTQSGTLIARLGYRDGDYSESYRQGEIVRLDRDLRVLSRGAGLPGRSMTVVGESAVFWGNAPMRASTPSGATVDFADPRLAAAGWVWPLGDLDIVADEVPPAALVEPPVDSTDHTAAGVLVGLLAVIGAGAVAVRRVAASA